MSTAHLMQEGQAPTDEQESLGTNDLDFMTVSLRNGQLRIGGSLMKSSIQTGRLQKLILDPSEQVAMISFQGIDVPVEINTAHHGKLFIKPTTGMTILPLIVPLDVLTALEMNEGLAVKPSFNMEAAFGFLQEVQMRQNLLYSSTGNLLLPSQCRAMLCRLGAETGSKADIKACLKLCAKLGIKGAKIHNLFGRIFWRVGGPQQRLGKCIRVLEERGYWIRLRGRVSSVCHPVSVTDDASPDSLRLFSLNHANELAIAA